MKKLLQVAIPLPVEDPFSYEAGDGSPEPAVMGGRVRVPFKNREIQGYVVGWDSAVPAKPLKPIAGVIDQSPVLSPYLLALTRWISEYYGCSWGEAIENALPKALKAGRSREDWGETERMSDPGLEEVPEDFSLTEEQQYALSQITAACRGEAFASFLLHGVTGSGKSEVYIRAIKAVLEMGKGVICLVPEIALTAQIRHFFKGHFSGNLEIIHSRLTDRERLQAWLRIREGKSRVVLGPRSALFSPVERLGLIIVDEEHETSYKQAESPRYHARDAARKRAELENVCLVLGSATPSLESMFEAQQGRMIKLELTKRVVERQLPEVRIIDLKREIEIHRRMPLFSYPLQRAVEGALSRKEGVLLLLNRRGFASSVQCNGCGVIVQCRYCQVSLTYHQSRQVLLCHYCNFQIAMADQCPSCGAKALKYVGSGTEKIESEIARFFPGARIARLDTDVARRKGMHESVIRDFRDGKIDILVGTQMIAKGFDFPRVTAVGVISADIGLALPDFRSSERTFQLLTQVAGRAGRGDLKGHVVIQTFSPDHHSIVFAKDHDYAAFYAREIEQRRELKLPPFAHLVNLIFHAVLEQEVYRFAAEVKKALAESADLAHPLPFEILGPAPLPFYKLRGHYRWHLMVKGEDVLVMNRWLKKVLSQVRKPSRVKMMIDVDPVSVL
ncbi:MAG: primosomal protein N' [Candidatus Omnitrophica bacterium]|nr:primosomal protein N' [Candidatus Omnitrophota bacterium]